jgi:hypothetical protein
MTSGSTRTNSPCDMYYGFNMCLWVSANVFLYICLYCLYCLSSCPSVRLFFSLFSLRLSVCLYILSLCYDTHTKRLRTKYPLGQNVLRQNFSRQNNPSQNVHGTKLSRVKLPRDRTSWDKTSLGTKRHRRQNVIRQNNLLWYFQCSFINEQCKIRKRLRFFKYNIIFEKHCFGGFSCVSGRFVSEDLLSSMSFCPEEFGPEDVLSRREFSPQGLFVPRTFYPQSRFDSRTFSP